MFEEVKPLNYPCLELINIPNVSEKEDFPFFKDLKNSSFPCLNCKRCFSRKTFAIDKPDSLICFYTNDEIIQQHRFVATITKGKLESFKGQPVFCHERKEWEGI